MIDEETLSAGRACACACVYAHVHVSPIGRAVDVVGLDWLCRQGLGWNERGNGIELIGRV